MHFMKNADFLLSQQVEHIVTTVPSTVKVKHSLKNEMKYEVVPPPTQIQDYSPQCHI
jgi:hypothetical protein